jgi:carbonic anhydrase
MTQSSPLIKSNIERAKTGAFKQSTIYPAKDICIVTCLDPRTDPADLFGLAPGDAAVLRNAGGRVNEALIDDLALITYLAETKLRTGPIFEVMVIHHNKCGTSWLADNEFRSGFEAVSHLEDEALKSEAVVSPADTVRLDVAKILSSTILSRKMTVSGHTYDVDTGLITTVLEAAAMPDL